MAVRTGPQPMPGVMPQMPGIMGAPMGPPPGMPGMPPMPGLPPMQQPMPMPMGGPMGAPPPQGGGRPASLGTLPAPSTAEQRAGFGAAVGAVASGPVMGAMPADVFAGGIPGGMMDGSIPRPVAMMRGGGAVQYMQQGGEMKSLATAGEMGGSEFVKMLEGMGLRDPSSGFNEKYTVIGNTLYERAFDPTTGREVAYQIRYGEDDQPEIAYRGSSGGEGIPSWASGATPGFTPTAERPGQKPTSITQFMEDTGASFEDAVSLLYGTVGSTRDIRDWNAIMSSSDPLTAARVATGQMYGQGGLERNYDPVTGKTYNFITGGDGSRLTSIPFSEAFARQGTTEQMLRNFGVSSAEVQAYLAANRDRLDPYTAGVLEAYQGPSMEGNFLLSNEYLSGLQPAADIDRMAAARGSAGVTSLPSGTGGGMGGGGQQGYVAEPVPVSQPGGGIMNALPGDVMGTFAGPMMGSVYQPTVSSIPTFVSGVSDVFGTRPVTYVTSPQATIRSRLGEIDLPARPESVNVFDWLQTPVAGFGGTR